MPGTRGAVRLRGHGGLVTTVVVWSWVLLSKSRVLAGFLLCYLHILADLSVKSERCTLPSLEMGRWAGRPLNTISNFCISVVVLLGWQAVRWTVQEAAGCFGVPPSFLHGSFPSFVCVFRNPCCSPLLTPALLVRSLRLTALVISAAVTLPVEAVGSPLALTVILRVHAFARETRILWSWADENNGLTWMGHYFFLTHWWQINIQWYHPVWRSLSSSRSDRENQ